MKKPGEPESGNTHGRIEGRMSMSEKKIPVTIITGFLGSGKTTLLNRILSSHRGENIAIIMNEYGEIGIDGKLLYRSEEQLVEFNNGCICCTVRQDLVRLLTSMCEKNDVDRVIIETTGLADPAPVASTFFISPEIQKRFEIDAFITVIDAFNIRQNLEESHEAMEQLTFADVLLFNKADTVDAQTLAGVLAEARELNPLAAVYTTVECDIPMDKIIDIRSFSLQNKLQVDPTFLEDTAHTHDQSVSSMALVSEEPLDARKFSSWMARTLQTQGRDILRSKGVFYFRNYVTKAFFQSVHMLSSLQNGEEWKEGEIRRTEFVIIGKNLDKDGLLRGFEACKAKRKPL